MKKTNQISLFGEIDWFLKIVLGYFRL